LLQFFAYLEACLEVVSVGQRRRKYLSNDNYISVWGKGEESILATTTTSVCGAKENKVP